MVFIAITPVRPGCQSTMKVFLVIFATLAFLEESHLDDKLNIDVLFESLCADSRRFVREQLYPNWKELAPYVNLKFVPFGKSASLEDGTKFICQHGPQECKGNRIMSCALRILPDQNMQVEYVRCFMETFRKEKNNPQEFGQVCALDVGLDFNEVMRCYNSKEGTLAQLKAEQATVKILPKFIPTVLYNGRFVQELQDESLIDFKGVICGLIADSFPEACQNPSYL